MLATGWPYAVASDIPGLREPQSPTTAGVSAMGRLPDLVKTIKVSAGQIVAASML